MAKMNARMMRTKMALEVAAELYTQRMSDDGQRRNDFHPTELAEEQFPGMMMGINGDLMGGMKAPIEVGKGRVDVALYQSIRDRDPWPIGEKDSTRRSCRSRALASLSILGQKWPLRLPKS